MDRDVRLALLGDHEAAKRLTEKGVLIPCPGCGGNKAKVYYSCGEWWVGCPDCDWDGPMRSRKYETRLAWNTRAPVLSAEEMEMLDAKD